MTPETHRAIGIDLGGTRIKAALVAPSGKIEARADRSTDPETGPEGIADRIADLVGDLSPSGALAGVGVGVPGVTTAEGTVVLAPNLHWHNVPFKHILQDRLGLRVEIDNDANVAALAEARAGVGAGCNTLVFLTLGTGIGGGIVLNGRLHHGASFSAGEIGHMCVLPDGPLCGCGKRGCLEALAAGPAMLRYVREGLSEGRPCALKDPDALTPETICTAAGTGDVLSTGAVAQSARYLGIAIANLIHLLSPDVIAIGGGISAAGDLLFTPILESARARTLEGMFDSTRIFPAALGNDAGSIGAAFLAL